MASIGTHCILELYDCPRELLDDHDFVRSALRAAAEHGFATLLDEVSHKFHPQGVTALALIAESHLAIHTWPEYGYAAVDVFTCGHRAKAERACAYLLRAFRARRHSLTRLSRGEEALRKLGGDAGGADEADEVASEYPAPDAALAPQAG